MSNAPTVRLDTNGKPAGFIDHPAEFETVFYEVLENSIGVLTLNWPDKLNAFNERMIREIRSIIWKVNFDKTVRVLIITGAGRDILGLDYENNLPSPQYRAYVRAITRCWMILKIWRNRLFRWLTVFAQVGVSR